MKTITLQDYNIVFDQSTNSLSSFLKENKYSKYIILVDDITKQYCLPLLKEVLEHPIIIEIPSGESYKNLDTCQSIWHQLIHHQIDRNALFINLGGGVIGDMGGFVAACFKRGIDFIQIPTTVLSQVDSSIGGKLGVDFQYGKNLIGLFKNPKLVYINIQFLKTLPNKQLINGFAEVFKHALIYDASEWNQLKSIDILNDDLESTLYKSLLVKRAIVTEDPFEKTVRKTLNFGHTIGHAIEACSVDTDENPLLHGEAIAIGMLCEAFIANKYFNLKEKELLEIQQVLLNYFPKVDISKYDVNSIMEYMKMDKKNTNTEIKAALVNEIGACVFNITINQQMIENSLDWYKNL